MNSINRMMIVFGAAAGLLGMAALALVLRGVVQNVTAPGVRLRAGFSSWVEFCSSGLGFLAVRRFGSAA